MLEIKNLNITFKKQTLVDGLSLSLVQGDIFALVGASGSGKSLTALAILDLLPKTLNKTGDIFYHSPTNSQAGTTKQNPRVQQTNMATLRGCEIGLIFQDSTSSLNAVFTVGYQLIETINKHQKMTQKQARKTAKDWLEKVGLLPEFYHRYPHELSGGQKQRVMIALALIAGAKLLIADEPTTALDTVIQQQVLDLLFTLRAQFSLSILLITHDLSLVKNIANKVGVMYQGRLITQGSLETVLNYPDNYVQTLLLGLTEKKTKNSTDKTLLSVKNISLSFSKRKAFFWQKRQYNQVLTKVSTTLNKGDNLAIVGESGSGKTTLARLIIAQLNSDKGHIYLANNGSKSGTNINKIPKKYYATQVQMVFQNVLASFNPRQILLQTLLEGMQALGVENANQNYLESLFNEVGLDKNLITRLPHQLSGGQLQRVSIVRALCVNPKIIICDEPTSALDNILKKQVLDLLLSLQKTHNISYIFITHDMNVVAYFANQVLVLKAGRVIESGSTQTVLKNPRADYTKQLIGS